MTKANQIVLLSVFAVAVIAGLMFHTVIFGF